MIKFFMIVSFHCLDNVRVCLMVLQKYANLITVETVKIYNIALNTIVEHNQSTYPMPISL